MSNRRKLRQLNRSSGQLQRNRLYWYGSAGNPTTQREVAERHAREQEEQRRGKFLPAHKDSADV